MSVIPSRRSNPGALPRPASSSRAKRTRRQIALEKLEDRVVLSYTFSYNPVTQVATAQSNGASNDTLAIEEDGSGDLAYSVNGAPFSSLWGGLTVPDSASTTVNINEAAGGTNESVQIGQPGAGHQASLMTSIFNIGGAPLSSSVTIDDSAGTVQAVGANAYQYNGINFTGPNSQTVNVNNFQTNGVTLLGSNLNDTFNVTGTAPTEPVNFVGGSGANIVNVGSGGTLAGINAVLTVTDPTGTATLNVNDTADAVNTAATIDGLSGNALAPYEITGLSPAALNYAGVSSGFGVTAININGGPGFGGMTYNVYGTSAGSTTTINDGAGPDAVNVGNPLDPIGLADVSGAVVVNGPGNTAITVDDSGYTGGGDGYTVTGTTVTTTPSFFGGLTYSGANALTLNTETGSGADVEVNGTASGVPTTINDNSTNSTVNVNSTGAGSTLTVNTVQSGTGSTVSVVANNEPVNVNLASITPPLSSPTAIDTVNIGSTGGPGTLDGIQAPISITDFPSYYNLNVNDQNGGARTFTVNANSLLASGTVTSYPPGTPFVTYSQLDLKSLTINGGSSGNTFNVYDTGSHSPTTLNTGLGNDVVNVYGTGSSTLNIHGQAGTDTVTLGASATPPLGAQGLFGTINVDNAGGVTALTVDDSQDPAGQNATLTDNGTNGTLTGLSPATINYVDADLSSLTLNGGSGGNTFKINGTFPGGTTTLNSGTGNDTVNVLATMGPLVIHGQAGNDTVNITNGGSTAGINGPISIDNTGGVTAVTVDASADTTDHNVSLSGDSPATLSGLTPAPITYTPGDVSSLTLDAGPSGNQTLNLDFSSGNPIPVTMSGPGLIWNAGANAGSAPNSHVLNITGQLPSGAFTSEVHNAEADSGPQHQGDIQFTDSLNTVTALLYTGLQPINDTAAAINYTFNNFAPFDNSFIAQNGPLVGGVQTITFASAATPPTPPAFETTNVGNKTNVTYNSTLTYAGVAGTVNITTPSTGLATLTINTLNNAPNNVSFVNEPAGVVTSYFGGTWNDTTNVTGIGVPSGTTLMANGGAGIDTLNYDAGGLVPTVTPGLLPGEVIISLPGYGSVDAVNYEQINITNTGPLVVAPTANAINSVEGFNYVNAPVGSFTTTVPVIFPTAPAGPAASDFTSTVDWGDPSPDLSGGTITQDATNLNNYFVAGSHTYATNGTYTTTMSVAFNGGSVSESVNGTPVSVSFPAVSAVSASNTATVIQGTLAVTAFPIVGTEGQAIASAPIATFIDAGGAIDASNFSASITVIDSAGNTVVSVPAASITQLGNAAEYSVTAPALTLPEEGTYQVLVSVTDNAGATPVTVSGASQAVIADAPLAAGPAVALTPNTGVALAGTTVVGNFTDGNTSAPASEFTAVIDWGDGSPTSLGTVVSTGGGAFTVDGGHTYAKPGTYATTIVVTEPGGSTVTLAGSSTVTDLPVTGATKSFTAVEGQPTGPFVLATFEDPNVLATVADVQATLAVGGWGDGTPTVAGIGLAIQQVGVDPSNGEPVFDVIGSHTYAEETPAGLPNTLSVIITTVGGATTTLTSPPGGGVTVLDAPLTGSAGTQITGTEGSSTGTVLLGSFVDANPGATVADFTTGSGSVVVNWGDGSAPQTLLASALTPVGTANGVTWTINAAHTYGEEGNFAYTVTVTDTGGSATVVSGSAVIADAALSAGAAVALTPNTGIALPATTVVGNFTDANTAAPASDFTAVIYWGDGSPSTLGTVVSTGGGAFTVDGGHTYAKPGAYATKIVVTDEGGSTVTLTGSATVTDEAVTAGAPVTINAVEGQNTGTVVLGTFTDPNPLATASDVSATLSSWGDGTPSSPVPVAVTLIGSGPGGAVFQITGSHTYLDETPAAGVTISMTVTTSGGVTTPITATAVVVDAPLSSTGAKITGVEGTATTPQIVATFTDTNPGATVADFTTGSGSVVVNWGDGSTPVTLPASDITASGSPNGVIFTVTAGHNYADEGTFATTITVTDTGGAVTIAHGTATITDAALADPGQTALTGTEGQPLGTSPVQVATFTDANPTAPLADFTASIDWGDGSPKSTGTISQPGGVGTAFFVNGNHTYASTGTYTITVVVHDVGGATITLSNTATINPVSSTISPLPGQAAYLTNASDTGLSTGGANTIAGPVYTSVTNPTFTGTLSPTVPKETVTLTATDTANGTTIPLGRATTNASGDWTVTSVALPQGTYSVTAVATDSNGNVTSPTTTIASDLVIDTTGPKVTNVTFNRAIGTIYVTYQDPTLPDGTLGSGVSMASITDAANYAFGRPHTPANVWLVTGITPIATGVPGQQEVAVQINNGRLIRGGFNFNFSIFSESPVKPSGVQDMAENAMDGEFYGTFPSGNGINGGNFNARLVAFHNQVLPAMTTVGTAHPTGTTAASMFNARHHVRVRHVAVHHRFK